MIRPCFPFAGEALDQAGLGGRQGDRGDAGRAGLPGGGGDRRVSGGEPQVSIGYCGRLRVAAAVRGRPGAGGRTTAPDREDWTAMALSWARAVRAVCR